MFVIVCKRSREASLAISHTRLLRRYKPFLHPTSRCNYKTHLKVYLPRILRSRFLTKSVPVPEGRTLRHENSTFVCLYQSNKNPSNEASFYFNTLCAVVCYHNHYPSVVKKAGINGQAISSSGLIIWMFERMLSGGSVERQKLFCDRKEIIYLLRSMD
jgi:hypothetical protein